MPIPAATTHTRTDQWSSIITSTSLPVAGFWLLGIWAAVTAFTTAYTCITTDGSFDYVEGVSLGHQLISAGDLPLYDTLRDQPPYSVPLYGPVFYWLNALLLDPESPSFLSTRVIHLLVTVYRL